MSSDGSHAQRVDEAFSRQAAAFEDRHHNHVFTLDAEWLFEPLQCGPEDLLLDVAAGTGHASRLLAPRVRSAVAVDVTAAMLRAGKAQADELGLGNIVFQRGDALALPFLDASFDVVLSRFATHHIEDPALQLAEMARCLRPGGRLALADMVADERPEVAAAQNRLERLRDASHTRTLPVSEIAALIESLDLQVISSQARAIDRPLQPWFEHAQAGEDLVREVRVALEHELEGGAPSGFQPHVLEGELMFRQTWACVIAVKRASEGRPRGPS
jgi:ubiquinone/menaquinone biosynthesis C-methylase UbiE